MIAIIDYRAGNLTSVLRAVNKLGFEAKITSDRGEILAADRVIFPGVGAAGRAMKDLKELGLAETIRDAVAQNKPVLGICLGTQIIMEYSEENDTECLGVIKGQVRSFPSPLMDQAGGRLKIPHMGWNRAALTRPHPIFQGIPPESEFYFVHTYFPVPADQSLTLAKTLHGIEFASALGRDNLIAVQFHPEKSGPPGLTLIKNFCIWQPGESAH
ncbi:MAG: imidazole glycerol phosphate synthase subunit HisH [Deltaproteobacteria bacterium]|nr:imidazole glycerol phosphate synthase subunit HisH [Deltaproteobacteria bacterium]